MFFTESKTRLKWLFAVHVVITLACLGFQIWILVSWDKCKFRQDAITLMSVMEGIGVTTLLAILILMPSEINHDYLLPYKATLNMLRDTDEVIPVQKMKKLVRHKSYDLDETRWTEEHELLTV